MQEVIIKEGLLKEYLTPERCYITELLNIPEHPQISIAKARVEPGVITRWHRLKDTFERYYILQGKGVVEIGALPPTEVNPGDIVIIPPMCPQRIKNTGTEDLLFLAICTPRFTEDVYEDIEDFPF
ncbi:MAG: cupin domain-containing protein [Syntrophorhabdaceae bacterium]|nr:cupin domain-containing protein [Syntrophorhabdaceae bacterium]